MRLTRFIPAAVAVLAFLPESVSAQQVQFQSAKFTSGNTVVAGGFSGSVNVGPYLMNYTASPADVFDIYCIDVDQTIGSTAYNARVLSFADAVNSSLSYNGIDNFTALKRVLGTVGGTGAIANTSAECLSRLAYTSAVTLQFGAVPTTAWDEIHIALWGAFSPSTTYAADGIGGSVAGSATLGAATSMASGYDYSNWRIILDESAWDAQAHGSYRQGVITEVTSVVPEPSTYALLGAGLLAVGFAARRRNRSTQQFSAGNSQLV